MSYSTGPVPRFQWVKPAKKDWECESLRLSSGFRVRVVPLDTQSYKQLKSPPSSPQGPLTAWPLGLGFRDSGHDGSWIPGIHLQVLSIDYPPGCRPSLGGDPATRAGALDSRLGPSGSPAGSVQGSMATMPPSSTPHSRRRLVGGMSLEGSIEMPHQRP